MAKQPDYINAYSDEHIAQISEILKGVKITKIEEFLISFENGSTLGLTGQDGGEVGMEYRSAAVQLP